MLFLHIFSILCILFHHLSPVAVLQTIVPSPIEIHCQLARFNLVRWGEARLIPRLSSQGVKSLEYYVRKAVAFWHTIIHVINVGHSHFRTNVI